MFACVSLLTTLNIQILCEVKMNTSFFYRELTLKASPLDHDFI